MIDVMNEDEGSLSQTEAACDALLAQFVLKAEGPARKLSEAIYEMLLGDVQNYLRDNATWNLANEIERCRRIEAENRALKERVKRLEADGAFLADRLTDFENDGCARTDDGERDWHGHVSPALARFCAALERK